MELVRGSSFMKEQYRNTRGGRYGVFTPVYWIAGIKGLSRSASGLELGDVIVAIDGKAIENYDDLYDALDTRKVDENVKVTVMRDRRDNRVDFTLRLVTLQ